MLAIVELATRVLPDDPVRMSKPLTGDLVGLRSARRGDYRVLLEIDPDEHVVLLVRVAHREHVYRPR